MNLLSFRRVISILLIIFVLLSIMPAKPVSAVNPSIVLNGDFSSGNVDFLSDYDLWNGIGDMGGATYYITTNPRNVHSAFTSMGDHTTGTGYMMVANGSDDTTAIVWEGSLTQDLVIGEQYDFSAWVANVYPSSPAILTFKVGSQVIGSLTLSTTGVWERLYGSFTATEVNPKLTLTNAQAALGGNDFAIDDIGVFVRDTQTPPSVGSTLSTTNLVSSESPSAFGENVTFTSTVTRTGGGSPTPTGNVDFYDGDNYIGTGILNGSGVATLTRSNLSVGSHTIQATYEGNSEYAVSYDTLVQVVMPAPIISSLSPNSGPSSGGTSVTINGQYFTNVSSVTFGGTDATSFNFVSDSQITAVAPARSIGTVNVAVTAVGGTTNKLNAFTYTNSAPTDILLSNTDFDENQPSGTVVGTFSTTDVDTGQTFTYAFADNCGGTDNSLFSITGNFLTTNSTFDYEIDPNSFGICVSSTDNGSPALSTTKQFTINLNDINDAPILVNPIANQSVNTGNPFVFTFADDVFSDQDGDSFTYTARLIDNSPLPAWLIFNGGTRQFFGTPAESDARTLQVKLIADDNRGGTAENIFYLFVVKEGNLPPLLVYPISDIQVKLDVNFEFRIDEGTFIDPDSNIPLVYSARLSNGNNLPDWLVFNPTSRIFTGTPPTGIMFLVEVKLFAFDNQGGMASDTFQIYNSTSNNLPLIIQTYLKDKNAREGVPFSYTISPHTFFDPEGDPISYTADLVNGSPLPAWLTFSSNSLTFSGTPGNGDVGALLVRLTGSDTASNSVSDVFRLAISSFDGSITNRVLGPAGGTENGSRASTTMPAGVIGQDANSYIQMLDVNQILNSVPGFISLNKTTDILIFDGDDQKVSRFASPLTICFQLSASQLQNYQDRVLIIATTPDTSTNFTRLTTTFDKTTGKVCAQTTHLSIFDLFVNEVVDVMPASGFAPGMLTARQLPSSSPSFEQFSGLRMEIPGLNVSENIVGVSPTQSGWDITWLGHQIGWLNTTAYPTWQGNSVLTGHAVDADGLPSVFADLGNLKYGDQVIVHLDGLKYIYEVREVSRFVNPSDKSAFKHENASWLTLITCNGFNEETGEYRWRTVVKAVMVQVR